MKRNSDDDWRVRLHPLAIADLDAMPAWAVDAVIELLCALKQEHDLDHPRALDICRSFPHDGKTLWRVKQRGGRVRAAVRVIDSGVVLEYADAASDRAYIQVVFAAVRTEATYARWIVQRVTALVSER